MNDEAVQVEIDTFMIGGYDTTATVSSFSLYLLAAHPESQRKVQDELDQVCGADPFLSETELGKLKYLECCIKEAMRL